MRRAPRSHRRALYCACATGERSTKASVIRGRIPRLGANNTPTHECIGAKLVARLVPCKFRKIAVFLHGRWVLSAGAPEEIRTPDPQIRSLVTPNYPADRSSRGAVAVVFSNSFVARGPTSALPNPTNASWPYRPPTWRLKRSRWTGNDQPAKKAGIGQLLEPLWNLFARLSFSLNGCRKESGDFSASCVVGAQDLPKSSNYKGFDCLTDLSAYFGVKRPFRRLSNPITIPHQQALPSLLGPSASGPLPWCIAVLRLMTHGRLSPRSD